MLRVRARGCSAKRREPAPNGAKPMWLLRCTRTAHPRRCVGGAASRRNSRLQYLYVQRTGERETVEWLASEYDCEPVDVTADPAWGIVQGEAAGMATFRFSRTAYSPKGFFAAVLRKGDGRVRVQVPKPRKAIFAPLARREGEEAARWVGQPQQMLFPAGRREYPCLLRAAVSGCAGNIREPFSTLFGGCCAVSFSEESCGRNIRSRCSMTFRVGRFRLWNCRPMKRSLICARRISPRSGCRRESTSSPSTACRWDGSNASAHAATTCTRRELRIVNL